MMAKFLVLREGMLRKEGYGPKVASSDFFPMIIEAELNCDYGMPLYEYVLERALDSISEGYRSNYKYVIVPMHDAVVLKRRPVQQYEYIGEPFK